MTRKIHATPIKKLSLGPDCAMMLPLTSAFAAPKMTRKTEAVGRNQTKEE